MQIIIQRMDKQQGPTVQHKELYSISCNKSNGKEYKKECVCVCVCVYNLITLLYSVNYTSIK